MRPGATAPCPVALSTARTDPARPPPTGPNTAINAAESLDVTGRYRDDVFSLRYILTHVEEYARHNGHADLLREHIDGTADQ